ncbi:calpain-A [Trichonephila clavipes]|nr:calpain-A [Trichonephila clavipes]
MGPRRKTSIDIRKFILRKIIGRFKSDGLIENKSGRGNKSILSDVAKRKVLKDIKIDPKLSAVKLAAETSRIMGRSVSAETVRNVIRHAGYSSRVARKKPFISLQNQKKHLEFVKTHQLKTDNFWKKVIFSDEIKHGGDSVMVWGCMASNGVGNLVFTDGILDHKLYIDILNNNLKESAKKLGLDGNFIFQQENDPKHTARNVKMCVFFIGDWKETRKADANGLVSGHAYTISAVATVKLSTGSEAYLVRIRNPWGNDTEWNGQWNDSDTNWHNVDLNTKEKIDYSKRGDGEFWMSYQDFCREFEEVTICSLTPDLTHHTTLKTNAVVETPQPATILKTVHGRWEEGKSCGGSRNNLVLFSNNPQYLLTVSPKMNRENESKCNIVVALMQLRRRCVRHPRRKMLQIAFVIFRSTLDNSKLEGPMKNFELSRG